LNYSELIDALNDATGFDLFRISVAIDKMLGDPKRVNELKQHLVKGQEIEYFDRVENRAVKATITEFKRTRLAVKNIDDGVGWNIRYYSVNINKVDTNISPASSKKGLDRNEVKVGDRVGFLDGDNAEQYGEIVRLNPKSVTLNCNGAKWRVGYSFLFNIIGPDIDALEHK
jgi:hypothetical protein